MHDLQVAAVELAAEDRALVRVGVGLAFVLDVEAAVADREVEPAVGPDDQAVHVVAHQRGVHAEAVEHDRALVGDAVAILVAQAPDLGDQRRDHVFADRQHAGDQAVLELVEALGEGRDAVERAVSVGVGEQHDALAVALERLDLLGDVLAVLGDAVGDRQRGEVVVEPAHVVAVVEHAVADAERLAHVDVAAVVDLERDAVADVRFGGDQLRGQPVGELDGGQLLVALVARFGDEHRLLGVGLGRAVLRGGGAWERERESEGEEADHRSAHSTGARAA